MKTEDTYVTVAVANNRAAIYGLKNSKNGWNWMKGFLGMPFPEKVQVGNTAYKFNWKYKDAIVEKSNGTKLKLLFF